MKLHLKPSQDSNHFNLSHTHSTTSQLGQLFVANAMETLPNDKISINLNNFTRTAPLAKPTFGRIKIHYLSTFVPYHIIKQDADAYITGASYFNGRSPKGLFISDQVIHQIFLSNWVQDYVGVTTNSADGPKFAKMNIEGSTQQTYITNFGRFIFKILRQLGYDVIDDRDDASDYTYNAYPLIAFFKAYNDLLSNEVTQSRSLFSRILNTIYNCDSSSQLPTAVGASSNVMDQNGLLTPSFLYYMFTQCRVLYNEDMFTTSWKHQMCPADNINNLTQFTYPYKNYIDEDYTDTSDVNEVNQNVSVGAKNDPSDIDVSVNAMVLDLVRKFDKWSRKNNYVGSLYTRQILARYGIEVSNVQHLYTQLLHYNTEDMVVGDVTSQSASDADGSQPLGSYAGKSVGSAQHQFQFDCKDFGHIITFCWYSPVVTYADGFDKSTLRTSPFDFYQPELDGLLGDPISVREIFNFKSGNRTAVTTPNLPDKIFGFTERYSNGYRTSRNLTTGDMILYNDLYNWSMYRTFSTNALNQRAQSIDLLYQPIYNSPFNNIFNTLGSVADNIYINQNIECHANRRMLSSSEATGLEQGSISISKNGNSIR